MYAVPYPSTRLVSCSFIARTSTAFPGSRRRSEAASRWEKLQREDVVNGFTSDSASEDQCEITDERHSYSFIHETAESLAPKPAGLVATSIGGKSVPAISHAARSSIASSPASAGDSSAMAHMPLDEAGSSLRNGRHGPPLTTGIRITALDSSQNRTRCSQLSFHYSYALSWATGSTLENICSLAIEAWLILF
jgi:hypothetical protein